MERRRRQTCPAPVVSFGDVVHGLKDGVGQSAQHARPGNGWPGLVQGRVRALGQNRMDASRPIRRPSPSTVVESGLLETNWVKYFSLNTLVPYAYSSNLSPS